MLHGMRTDLSEKRMKMKALLASSLGNSPPGKFICNKCHVEVGSAAALCSHVRLHSQNVQVCEYCGFTTDIRSERFVLKKKNRVHHGLEATTIVTTEQLVEHPIHHECNGRHKHRQCSDTSYRTTKK
jgi:hypothetical protein